MYRACSQSDTIAAKPAAPHRTSLRVLAMKMTTRMRLGGLSAVLILFSFALGELGVYNTGQVVKSLHSVYVERVVPMRDLKVASDLYAVTIVNAAHKRRALLLTKEQALASIGEAERTISDKWQTYKATTLTPAEETLIAEIEPMMAASADSLDRLKTAIRNNSPQALREYIDTKLYPTIDPLSERFAALIEVQLSEAERVTLQAEEQAAFARNVSLILIAFAVIFGAALAWTIVRSLLRQLGAEPADVAEAANRIAEGRLDVEVKHDGAGSGASVMAAMYRMRQNLHAMVSAIVSAAQQISAASAELGKGSEEALHAGDAQSESASSMAAAMEQMAVSISHISDNARDANGLASRARDSAGHGHEVVRNATEEMVKVADMVSASARTIDQLANESDNIGAIVGVIREIADQTNLLALNAAIEAARAGEQGRGFAVVADEVRKLAERTAQSTGEIVGLVEKIQSESRSAKSQMQQGTEMVERSRSLSLGASESIAEIGSLIGEAQAAVTTITESLDEQRSTSALVANKVEEVAGSADEGVNSLRAMNASVGALQQVSASLKDVVGKFRV